MFENIQTIAFADGTADVYGMIAEAMSVGRPAADHRSHGVIADEIREHLTDQFRAGREWVEYDWRFLNGRASGVMSFHSNGQLYGAYRFI